MAKSKKRQLFKNINFTFRYIDDLINMKNKHFHIHISNIYPPELELKETTESTTTVYYLDHLADSDGMLRFKLFDKRYYFTFPIVNFTDLDSNVHNVPV